MGTRYLLVNRGLALLIAGMSFAPAVRAAPGREVATAGGNGKFDTPVWHPDARWELDPEPFAARGQASNLDGPRREIMWRRGFWPWGGDYPLCMQRGMPMHLLGYDGKSGRFHVVSRGARGNLDGPLSRARWGGESYVRYSDTVFSFDRRFLVATDPTNGGALRVVDLKEQTIRTLLPPGAGAQGVDMDAEGLCLVLMKNGVLLKIDAATGAKIAEIRMKAERGLTLGEGKGLALDRKRNWLYASGHILSEGEGRGGWHVWRFDLNGGGAFHGVLKGEKTGPSAGYAGPFDGFKGYGAMQIRFGPDDPEYRFLYARTVDTGTFQRLDLERKVVAAFSGPGRNNKPPAMFIEKGVPVPTTAHAGPGWLPDGSIVLPGLRAGASPIYRRVK